MQYDDCSDRILLHHKTLDAPKNENKYGKKEPEVMEEVSDPGLANLLTSKCADGMHAPVIDFDYPIQVYPSSHLGHYHLYLGKKIPWEKYELVLQALADAELIEPGYAGASIAKGFSAVRPIGVVKTSAPKGVEVLIENAKLKKINFALQQERDYLLTLLQDYINPKTDDF